MIEVLLLNPESVEVIQAWESGKSEAVLLMSGEQTIGLTHWPLDTTYPFEPYEVDTLFSCHAELLPSQIRDTHMFPNSVGVNEFVRFGRLVIFKEGEF